MDILFKVGSILENSIRQFTKVIFLKNGVYGLSGWTSREHAEKATVVRQRVNKYGLQYACVKAVTSSADKSAPSQTKATSTSKTKAAKKVGSRSKGKKAGTKKK
jgi:hypothetical protein